MTGHKYPEPEPKRYTRIIKSKLYLIKLIHLRIRNPTPINRELNRRRFFGRSSTMLYKLNFGFIGISGDSIEISA